MNDWWPRPGCSAPGLVLNQVDQQSELRGVNSVLQVLDDIDRCRLGTEQRGEEAKEPERPIRDAQRGDAPAALRDQTQEEAAGGVLVEDKVIDVHCRQLADPLQQPGFWAGSPQVAASTEERFSPRSPSVVCPGSEPMRIAPARGPGT